MSAVIREALAKARGVLSGAMDAVDVAKGAVESALASLAETNANLQSAVVALAGECESHEEFTLCLDAERAARKVEDGKYLPSYYALNQAVTRLYGSAHAFVEGVAPTDKPKKASEALADSTAWNAFQTGTAKAGTTTGRGKSKVEHPTIRALSREGEAARKDAKNKPGPKPEPAPDGTAPIPTDWTGPMSQLVNMAKKAGCPDASVAEFTSAVAVLAASIPTPDAGGSD